MSATPISTPRSRRLLRAATLFAAIIAMAHARPAAAQQDNPVWVDDSPRAWELFQRAEDQGADNTAEAIRLFQELLDEYPLKLVPINESAVDHLTSVRRLVTRRIRGDAAMLERYRNIATAEATRLLESGELAPLARSRSLTRPGLVALLRLGQRAIEDARFEIGLAHLAEAAEHPDLVGADAAHCWSMTAMAAHFLGDARRGAAARQALVDLGDAGAAMLGRIDELSASADRPNLRRGVSSMDPTETSDLSDLVAEEIWSVPLEDSLLSRQYANLAGPDRTNHPSRQQRRRAGDLMTAAATVAGSTVYINQGETLLSLDRFTGRTRWSFSARHRLASLDRDTDQTLDMNLISLSGTALVTLTGHATEDGRATDGEVLCLDARSGERRWSRSLDRIGGIDDYEGLFPHGEPLVKEGSVYVLARKVSKQLLTSCYVVALDVENGELQWLRHIASSGGLRRSARNLSSPVYVDGDLYVATPVGAVARLRAGSGEIAWLRWYNVPISPRFQDQTGRPWEVSSAVVTADQVVAIQPGQRRVVFLDRETGHQLRSFTADTRDGWSSPRYLLGNDHSIYAIGREIRAFRRETPGRPTWFLPALPRSTESKPEPVRQTIEIRGRVQVANGALIVPTLDGVLVIDDETGALRHRLPVRTVGTPVATDAQLLLAGSDRLDSYMSFHRAEEMLRQRITSDPRDPEPALSLLRLGARARRLPLALEAAELAREAIDADVRSATSGRSRQELVELLLELDAANVASALDEGESLHALISTVALRPEQRVEHRLAYGRWLVAHSLARAVEQYQAVLSEPDLAGVSRSESGIMRSAAQWATDRLTALLAEHGPTIYAPQADFARIRLDQITARTPGNSARLLALAAEFPHADAAIDASLLAADLYQQRREPRAAAAALLSGYRRAPRPESVQRLLGPFVDLCIENGWRSPANAALDESLRTSPDATLESRSGLRAATAWRRELAPETEGSRPARLGATFDAAEVRFGRLIPIYPDGNAKRRSDSALSGSSSGSAATSTIPAPSCSMTKRGGSDGRPRPWLDSSAIRFATSSASAA
jgi:outer membrane protein assembly factor BamB